MEEELFVDKLFAANVLWDGGRHVLAVLKCD